MSDHLGFKIAADGCSWICADCGKEFPLGGTLHLYEAKLPEEYRKLREQIATLTRERDEALAALDVYEQWRKDRKHFHDSWLAAGRTFDNLPRESQARIQAEANLVVIMEESIGLVDPHAALAARDALMKRQGAIEAWKAAGQWCAEWSSKRKGPGTSTSVPEALFEACLAFEAEAARIAALEAKG